MDARVEKTPAAWQPFTPRGIAAFATASWGRLLVLQTVCALLVAGTVVWFLHEAWFPVIEKAIKQLPEQGELRFGTLDWKGEPVAELAENQFLALTVDLKHSGSGRSPAQIQIEFGAKDAKFISLFGYAQNAYPRHWRIAFNRPELGPWWGAWGPPLLAIVAGLTIVTLLLSWSFFATIYFLPAWFIGWFANRNLSAKGSWLACGAAQMPGALFLTAAILLYGCGLLDLIRFLGAAGAHFLITWFFVIAFPLAAPRRSALLAGDNPFARPAPNPPAGK